MKTIEEIDLKRLIEDETGKRFNRANKIKSILNPADDTPSFSIYFSSNLNKWKYKDFSTGEEGDAIDFLRAYRNMDYDQAREYLGMEVIKTPIELYKESIEEYVLNNNKNSNVLGVFVFVDENNKPIYAKVKFRLANGKKSTPYFHIEKGQVLTGRGHEEVPYNYYNLIRAIENEKKIVIVEGEKDVNTINHLIGSRGYTATSLKSCKDLEMLKENNPHILVVGDTGEAGEKYVNEITRELKPTAKEFRIVKLPGLKSMGDNKDVTDWIESGHNANDLIQAFYSSLDLKDINVLQQDNIGIYKTTKKDDDIKKIYLTDFTLVSAYRLKLIDDEKEGIKLKFRSRRGDEYERVGNVNIFNDIRTFRNFLGTMDLNFLLDKTKDVVELGKWINDYWAIDNQEIHKGVQFLPIGDKLYLTTQEGSITVSNIDESVRVDSNSNNVEVANKEFINKEELEELWQHILAYIEGPKALTILGTIINNLCVYQAEQLKVKFHHLLIVGESGSGKSTILERVISPILNYPIGNIKSIGMTTAFAIEKDCSTGNYTTIYDEFKPSMFSNASKMKNISDMLRNLYDRKSISKGGKDFKVREYKLRRPIILAGEESYPNSESALINRSAIVYLSKGERTEKQSNNMEWLENHEEILNKFGRSLIDIVLKLPLEDYKTLRNSKAELFKLSDRVLNTAVNIACGIEIYNKLLTSIGLDNLVLKNYEKYIESNLKEEVLDGGDDTKSIVEQMFLLFNDMVENRDIPYSYNIFRRDKESNYLLIRTSEMINEIFKFCKQVGSQELIPLKLRDFKKQAKKAKYRTTIDGKDRVCRSITVDNGQKSVWYDVYDLQKIRNLGCDSLAPLSRFEKKVENSYKVDNIYKNNVVQGNFEI